MEFTKQEIERFFKRIEVKESGCWEWTGGRFEVGYGMFSLKRGHRKTFAAHRVSWCMRSNRDIPKGMLICHTCDNRICVNPEHLYLGTYADNNRDTLARNRGNRKEGESCSWAKVSSEGVLDILTSKEKQSVLARKYGVSQSQISSIKTGRRRKIAHFLQTVDVKTR